jgi:hypothetical protein
MSHLYNISHSQVWSNQQVSERALQIFERISTSTTQHILIKKCLHVTVVYVMMVSANRCCMHMHMFMYICMYVCIDIYVYIYMYVYIYIHISCRCLQSGETNFRCVSRLHIGRTHRTVTVTIVSEIGATRSVSVSSIGRIFVLD